MEQTEKQYKRAIINAMRAHRLGTHAEVHRKALHTMTTIMGIPKDVAEAALPIAIDSLVNTYVVVRTATGYIVGNDPAAEHIMCRSPDLRRK